MNGGSTPPPNVKSQGQAVSAFPLGGSSIGLPPLPGTHGPASLPLTANLSVSSSGPRMIETMNVLKLI